MYIINRNGLNRIDVFFDCTILFEINPIETQIDEPSHRKLVLDYQRAQRLVFCLCKLVVGYAVFGNTIENISYYIF